jgi:hypothetical protein
MNGTKRCPLLDELGLRHLIVLQSLESCKTTKSIESTAQVRQPCEHFVVHSGENCHIQAIWHSMPRLRFFVRESPAAWSFFSQRIVLKYARSTIQAEIAISQNWYISCSKQQSFRNFMAKFDDTAEKRILRMSLVNKVQVRPLASIKGGMIDFYTPQISHETILVQVPPQIVDDLFVHRFQTDQLLVVKGSFVIVILQNRRYQYIALSEDYSTVITIPPGILHGAINLSTKACLLVNAVLHHGAADERDYRPMKPPFPYDLAAAQAALAQLEAPA